MVMADLTHLLWMHDEFNLTNKELEVLSRVLSAASSKQIAYQMGIRPGTVDVHRANIRKKLSVNNTAGVFARVMRGPTSRREGTSDSFHIGL